MSVLKTIISRNMAQLCSCTETNKALLNSLRIQGIIGDEKVASWLAETDPGTRNYELYSFLCTARTDRDLDGILQALQKSNNAGAYDIFSRSHTQRQGQGQIQGFQEMSMDSPGSPSVPQAQSQSLAYQMSGRKKALIINVLKNRRGAEMDTFALAQTLLRCGFEVVVAPVLTEKGIFETLSTFKEDLDGVGVVLVGVMSHGTSAYEFLTEDDKELHLKKDIVQAFNNIKCRELRGVPKIFLANFCRGDRVDSGTDWSGGQTETDSRPCSTETDSVGSYSDILICHGTYDEHYAYRTAEGTWFIQSFCRILAKYGDGTRDILDLMNLVFKEVNERETEEGGKQCPPFEIIGLCNKLYLKYE